MIRSAADSTSTHACGACCAPSSGSNEAVPTDGPCFEAKAASSVDTRGMRLIPGGPFMMGAEDVDGFVADGEGPVREITVGAFLIDATTVCNAEFAAFVEDTGYVTD